MKVLVTGGAGRIAQWILPHLPAELALTLTDCASQTLGGRAVQALDITSYDAVRAAMEGMDAVVHLAIASERNIVSDRARFVANEGPEYLRFNEASIDVNVRGSYHVFEAARAAGVRRIVCGGSLAVLLGHPEGVRLTDELPPRPPTFYAVTKLWLEHLGAFYAHVHGLTVYCLRFGNPYPQNLPEKIAQWRRTAPGRRLSVSFVDLAGSITAALTARNGPAFGAFNIVSDCEDPVVDCSGALAIGWRPRTFCETDGRVTLLDP